ncbi:MAG: nitrite/sulfite reductase [Deltaproteobacteria bacterium]|nr:nitrite/sulfite reductase [Deltaproteobacteria bacterium]
MREAPSWDLVLKRNSIERLKREKFPFEVLAEVPQLAERGYEHIPEEDIVRLQWYGLYHDKPKIGTFMMRVKVPSGILSPRGLRTIGEISLRYGNNSGELSTRQNIQLHWIRLETVPEIFPALEQAGLTTVCGCGDTVRNITGCPVAGLERDELFDATALIIEAAQFFKGNREYSDLPRKHKITIATCPYQCNAPEINCVGLVGARMPDSIGSAEGERLGFAVRVGGGQTSTPRLARHLGVFVDLPDAIPLLRAILDVWKSDPRYRLSRVKARLKFMIDDYGPEKFREMVEEKLGRKLDDLMQLPVPKGETGHIGVHAQKQPGLYYVGFPVSLGLMKGEQMIRIADVAASYGGDIRLTRQQNFILTQIPESRLPEIIEQVTEIGFSPSVNHIRALSVACTGELFCNFSVTPTKSKLEEIITHLEKTFGQEVADLKLNLDGCPHACAHHWTGDIGLQGTTGRGVAGEKVEAFDIILRGGLGAQAAIGKPVLRRVPSAQVENCLERLVQAYLDGRQAGESFKEFCDRCTDAELIAIAAIPGAVAGQSTHEAQDRATALVE